MSIGIWLQASSLRNQLIQDSPSSKLLKTSREGSLPHNSILMARTTWTDTKYFHHVFLPRRHKERPHRISSVSDWSYSSSSMMTMIRPMLKNRSKVASKVQTQLRVAKKKDWFLIRNRSMEINLPWTRHLLALSLNCKVQNPTTNKKSKCWPIRPSPPKLPTVFRTTMKYSRSRINKAVSTLIRRSHSSRPSKLRKSKSKSLNHRKMKTSMLALSNGQSIRKRGRKDQVDPRSKSYQSLTKARHQLRISSRRKRITLHSQMEDGSAASAKTTTLQEESDAIDAPNKKAKAISTVNPSISLRKERTLILARNSLLSQRVTPLLHKRRPRPRNRW